MNETLTLAIKAESGMVSAWAVVEARLVPKIDTSAPGATAWPEAKLAPFTTLPLGTTGV